MLKLGVALAVVAAVLLPPVPAVAGARPAPSPAASPSPRAQEGTASWYRARNTLSASHRTLPLGSRVRVVARNGRSVTVTITGRGPFIKGRIIDLSVDAFKKLATLGTGLLRVRVERLGSVASTTRATVRTEVHVHTRTNAK